MLGLTASRRMNVLKGVGHETRLSNPSSVFSTHVDASHLYPSVRTTRVSKLLGGAKAFLNARYAWPHGWPRCERSMERKAHAFVGEITVAIIPVALRQISRNTCTQTNKPNDTRGSVPRRCARPQYILHVPIHDTPMKSTPD